MGSLEHPSIVPVHALGRDDEGRPVFVMKRIEGVSWRSLARDEQHPAWARIDTATDDRLSMHLEILMQVCNALHFAHGLGYVHRDVKPANVMIGAYGEVYLVDWGIEVKMATGARESVGAPFGTPTFMAPEMVWGDPARVDARTDVYLLGATLHNVLTGKPRHKGDSVYGTLYAARDSLPYPYGPEIPAELAAICNKATSAAPEARYPTALAFRRALAEYLRHRWSIALCDEAGAQLAEVRAAIPARAEGGGAEGRRVHRLMVECRFGFMQALRTWKDNAAARAGLSECLGAMIEHELSQQDREGAAALIAELPEPRPDLEQRLAALDAELLAKRERDVRLRRLEHDLDLSVGARFRLLVLAPFTAICMVGAVWVLWQGPRQFGHRERVGGALVADVIVCATIVFARRRLMATAIGRTWAGVALVWAVAQLGHRLLGARLSLPLDAELTLELWQTGSVLAAGAVAVRGGGVHFSVIPCVVGVILMVAWLDQALVLFTVTGTVAVVITVVVAYRSISPRR
jgi:serine/threonine-protein kinase